MPSAAGSALTPAQISITVTMPAQWSEPGLLFRNYAGANGAKVLPFNGVQHKYLYDWASSTYEYSDDAGANWWPSVSTFGGGLLVWWSAASVLNFSWGAYTIEWGTSQFNGSTSTRVPVLGAFDAANGYAPAEKIILDLTGWA